MPEVTNTSTKAQLGSSSADIVEAFTPQDAWDELVHKDDRTSPEDYPDMCLITFEELQDYILRASLQPATPVEAARSSESLKQLFEDHYWDSLQADKEIVMKHVNCVLGFWAASQGAFAGSDITSDGREIAGHAANQRSEPGKAGVEGSIPSRSTASDPAQSPAGSARLIAAIIDPVAFDPITLSDNHPSWLCRRETALETANKILAFGVAKPAAATPSMRDALESIAGWRKVNIQGEYEHGLRDIIRSITECAAAALEATSDLAQPPANPWRDDFENAPTEMHEYFLVRPKGIHPGRGGLFLPTIVQRIDGEFYATDNEVDPIYFGQNEADDHPLKTTLEWQPLPSNWTCSISSTTRETAGGANEG